jgi:orotidine-5'-phosphate decarboxylase
MHDIPTTVHRAARVVGALGVDYLTLHAQGGVAMLRAGVEGLAEGAEDAGLATPTALAVTILTSDDGAPEHILPKRVGAAVESGCGGIVCAASDVRDAALFAPRLTIVVPGIRPEGTSHHDQAAPRRRDALDSGADLLVVGRAVTQASDPAAAAAALIASIA